MRDWIDNNFIRILALFVMIGLIASIAILIVCDTIPVDEKIKNELYEGKEIIEQDFSNITQVTGATCEITENEAKVVLRQKDYELKLIYDKANTCISETFVDHRIGKWGIGVDFAFAFCCAFASMSIGATICLVVYMIEDIKLRKRKATEKEFS